MVKLKKSILSFGALLLLQPTSNLWAQDTTSRFGQIDNQPSSDWVCEAAGKLEDEKAALIKELQERYNLEKAFAKKAVALLFSTGILKGWDHVRKVELARKMYWALDDTTEKAAQELSAVKKFLSPEKLTNIIAQLNLSDEGGLGSRMASRIKGLPDYNSLPQEQKDLIKELFHNNHSTANAYRAQFKKALSSQNLIAEEQIAKYTDKVFERISKEASEGMMNQSIEQTYRELAENITRDLFKEKIDSQSIAEFNQKGGGELIDEIFGKGRAHRRSTEDKLAASISKSLAEGVENSHSVARQVAMNSRSQLRYLADSFLNKVDGNSVLSGKADKKFRRHLYQGIIKEDYNFIKNPHPASTFSATELRAEIDNHFTNASYANTTSRSHVPSRNGDLLKQFNRATFNPKNIGYFAGRGFLKLVQWGSGVGAAADALFLSTSDAQAATRTSYYAENPELLADLPAVEICGLVNPDISSEREVRDSIRAKYISNVLPNWFGEKETNRMAMRSMIHNTDSGFVYDTNKGRQSAGVVTSRLEPVFGESRGASIGERMHAAANN